MRSSWPSSQLACSAANWLELPALSGKGGAITIAHDGRYGDLSGKSVALEAATGFGFDSPMVWRSIR